MPSTAYYAVDVNNKPFNFFVSAVQLIQEYGKHTIMTMDVQYTGPGASRGNAKARTSWSYLREGTPVRITYGNYPSATTTALGYVTSHAVMQTSKDPVYSGTIVNTVRYTITGTTWKMQSTVNKAWKNYSPTSIASAVAAKNGLRAVVHPVRTAYDYRLQNLSDFKFLKALADEIGYKFYVDNTDLYFVNPNIVMGSSPGSRDVPQFWRYNNPGIKDTLQEFIPTVGTTTEHNYIASRTMGGLNPSTGFYVNAKQGYDLYQAFEQGTTAPVLDQYVGFPVESYAEAQQRLNAYTVINQYWVEAKATVIGDSRVKPNNMVQLIGTGIPEDDAGVWLVKKAVHNLTKPARSGNIRSSTYRIDMELTRNQSFILQAKQPSRTAAAAKTIPPKLVNGVWKSTNIGAIRNAK